MGRSVNTPLKERKIREQQREQAIQKALSCRKRVLTNDKRDKKQKKKSVGELLCMLDICGIEGTALQPACTYIPRSHNLDRQLIGLLNHMFVRYHVPAFLYQVCLKSVAPLFKNERAIFRQWFVTLAQGGSFPKLVRGYMTSKEAFLFLSAPVDNRVHENVWWAKMKAAGLPFAVIDKLIERIFSRYFRDDPSGRMAEVIQFYARFHQEMNRVTFGEVTDFLVWKLRNDPAFRLKGRTVGSVIKLTNQWQVLMQKARLGQCVEWKGLGIPDWEFEARDKIWTAEELRNNRELMNEGRKQRHCVYSYVQLCMDGRSAIFSLRGYRKAASGCKDDGSIQWDRSQEVARVTIEANSRREIVQVRGPLNRPPTVEEKQILRQWTGEKGLVVRA